MKTVLFPRNSILFPTRESRERHLKRNALYPVEKFATYNDWFHFIHLDPYTRRVHAFGMISGSFLYVFAAYHALIFGLSLKVLALILAGAFFFFFLPLLSHYFYEGGTAKSAPDKFHSTFIPVIHINLMTLTGTYDRWLRNFIVKYPFTVDAWDLEERPSIPRRLRQD